MRTISKKLTNRMNMYAVVLASYLAHTGLFVAFPAIAAFFGNLQTMYADLESLVQQKLLIITGLARDKKATKELLVKLLLNVSGAIYSYAHAVGNNELKDSVNYCKSDLTLMKDAAFIAACHNIWQIATDHAADIAGYGVDANMLITLSTSTDLYAKKRPKPWEAIKHRSSLTSKIIEQDSAITDLLKNNIDKSILNMETDNPLFVADYFNSREIVDAGLRHDTPRDNPDALAYLALNITDTEGNPLEDAVLILTGDDITYVEETDEDGDGLFDGVKSGDYILTISVYGKKTIEKQISFAANDEFDLDIIMETDPSVPQTTI
jgi:hypothetical protein